jgi:formylglycine-generating enzyme required for sulfatase activity
MKRLVLIALTVGWMIEKVAYGQAPVITSFHGNGQLMWTNSITNVAYRVEWASSLTGTWYQSWQPIMYLEARTNAGMSAEVPMFYRVVMMTNPAPVGMVFIEAGRFAMGDNYGQGGGTPVHSPYVSAFFMDRYEVTKAKWDQVYAWAITNGYTFDHPGWASVSTHPVTDITWYDCVKWCNARSQKEGLSPVYYTNTAHTGPYKTGTLDVANDYVQWDANGYRLPTEVEWEKASRGNLDGHHYPWPSYGGGASNHLDGGKANYSGSLHPGGAGTTAAGYYNGSQQITNLTGVLLEVQDMANGYGLYDMAGNVFEMCWDWTENDWYGNPQASIADPPGPATGTDRAIRGGSYWEDFEICMRCSHRFSDAPSTHYTDTGFRCVRRQ